MGLKAGLQIIQQTGKAVSRYTDDFVGFGVRNWTKPTNLEGLRLAPRIVGDTVQVSQICNFKNVNKEFLMTIKPSKFRSILASRNDITDDILMGINTPDKLALYDKTINLLKDKKFAKSFYKNIFKDTNTGAVLPDVTSKLDIVPDLLKRGYSELAIAKMPITDFNKDQINYILDNKEKILKILGKNFTNESVQCLQLNDIIRYVDNNNIRYLEECLKSTGEAQNLVFWKQDSSKILNELCSEIKNSQTKTNILERIFRRNLSYNDVFKVAQNGKLNSDDIKLLEFVNFDKLKNIGINDLGKLNVEERKNLLSGFISSLRPVSEMSKDGIPKTINYLSSRMKIFETLANVNNVNEYRNRYYDIIRKILNSIPETERKVARKSTGLYRGAERYLRNNPIPSLVDDLEKLPLQEVIVNGKKIRIIEVPKDTNLNLAIHQTADPRSILNLEAMEVSDNNALLCTGLKGYKDYLDTLDEVQDFVIKKTGKSELHFGPHKIGVALKPKENSEIFLQSYTDIWSDGGKKTPYNIVRASQKYLNNDAPSYVPELIKKELNLSQLEYTTRMQKIAKATTLDEIEKLDPEVSKVIRRITRKYPMFEGLMQPNILGVCVDANLPLEQINQDILEFCAKDSSRRLIRISGY